MSSITIDLPQETLAALKVSAETTGDTVRMAAAMKLFEIGRISSGSAAALAGVPRVVFLSRLAEFSVDAFRLTEEELRSETRLA